MTTVAPVVTGPAQVPARRRLLPPVAGAVLVAGWAGALRLRDPHASGSWGSCPFLVLTGLPCPVCGGLRAVNDLTHGDLAAALGSNAFVVLLLPVAVGWWLLWVRRALRPPGPGSGWTADVPLPAPATVVAAVGLLVLFGVLRWLPFASALAP